jgi:dTDP-4-dehydrorhamnose reductase
MRDRPDLVVNCAGYTVDAAEADAASARAVNTFGSADTRRGNRPPQDRDRHLRHRLRSRWQEAHDDALVIRISWLLSSTHRKS